MSKYTTEVRYICEKYAGLDESVGYLSIRDVISRAREVIFDFDYPIFDENYRSVLETKILKHFYTREIGEETVGLWKLRLDARMNEIMPYYNQRYESELIKFNPLYDTQVATSRNDVFNSDKNDNNVRNVINDGADIVNTNDLKKVTNSGRDVDTLSGTDTVTQNGSIAHSRAGTDNVHYEDVAVGENESFETTTHEHWDNASTTDWHYNSDTPQSTISEIGDNNYATSFTKDVHSHTNTMNQQGDITGKENYNKDVERIEHGANNNTDTHYGSTFTDTYNNKTDATTYGKVDTFAHGKVTDTDETTQGVTSYGKITTDGEVKVQGLQTTDEWLENIVGKRNNKSYSQMLNEFRTTFLNIDMEIINELNDLFFNLW